MKIGSIIDKKIEEETRSYYDLIMNRLKAVEEGHNYLLKELASLKGEKN